MYTQLHLNYGAVIYQIPQTVNTFNSSISLNPLMEKIEQVQYNAALAITGSWRGTNRSKLFEELGWETLSDRRWSRRLIQLFKICNDITPQYLRTHLPCRQIGSLRGQDPNKFQEFSCNTKRYMNSFYPDSIRSWNNIGVEYSSSNSISTFKTRILSLVRPKEK